MLLPPRTGAGQTATAPADLPLLHREELANGLLLEFFDRSNRYFGDYHRVCIEIRTTLSLDAPVLGPLDADLLQRARRYFGPTLIVTRTRERMGVEGARVAATMSELIEGVRQEASRYLSRPDYPVRLLMVEVEKRELTGKLPLA